MTDMLGRIENVTEEVLQRSGRGRADIDIVIRTGGVVPESQR